MFYYIYFLPPTLFSYIYFYFCLFPGILEFWRLVTVTFKFNVLYNNIYRKNYFQILALLIPIKNRTTRYCIYINNRTIKGDFKENIKCSPNQPKQRNTKRQIIWFNPPYSVNVKTNVGNCDGVVLKIYSDHKFQ